MHLRLISLFLIAAITPLAAQDTPAPSTEVAAVPAKEAGPEPIPLADVVTRADAVEAAHVDAGPLATLNHDAADISRRAREMEALQVSTTQASRPGGLLETLRELETRWQAIADEITARNKELTARANLLDKQIALVPTQQEIWKKTLETSRDANTPPEIRKRIEGVLKTLSTTAVSLEKERATILSAQSRVAEQGRKVADSLAALRSAHNAAVARLFMADLPPIWSPESWRNTSGDWARKGQVSISAQYAEFREFVGTRWLGIIQLIVGFGVVAAALIWVRRLATDLTDEDPALSHATPVLNSPLSTAAVLMLFVCPTIFGFQPRLFWAILSLLALFPIMRILRLLLDRGLFPILHALVAFTIVSQIRKLAISLPDLSRLLLLLEVMGGAIFIVWFLYANRAKAGEKPWWKVTRMALRLALVFFAVIFLALALGYFRLGDFLGASSLSAAYAGILLYAAVVILRGLMFFALRVHPLADLRAVRLNRPKLQRRFDRFLYFVATLLWGLLCLDLFSLKGPFLSWLTSVLNAETNFKSLHISLGAVLAFGITLWAAAMISRFIRFVLEEDIYHRFKVASGPSYAISTLLHYVLLMVGFFVAIAALGVDMTKFAVLAGAMGVGIGLGLQNIFSNFVSGIILLFERPVNVGDVVQVGDATGMIRRIGIRASVIRIANSSELIVPNSMLISEKVTNWTLSNRQRRVELPVGVGYRSDPKQVMELLSSVAEAHPLAAKFPEAQTLMMGFGADALNFEVRVWTNEFDQGAQIRSDLAVSIHEALNLAGIETPFPQRDLHLRSVAPAVADSLREAPIRRADISVRQDDGK